MMRSTGLLAIVCVAIACPAGAAAPPPASPQPPERLSPEQAAAGFQTPPGFRVECLASEPDVQNPVAMAWDFQGRLWIAENHTYSDITEKFDLTRRDRVLIFDDADGDGRLEKPKLFTDGVQRLGGIEIATDGVWLICPPNLLFMADRNHDDVPDGPAEIALDGFTVATENHHTFANGLKFGPDGWLYGRAGASSPGEIGTPGTPNERRIPLRGGIWRYHPKTRRFEVLAHGTTNPWGHDWNALGECFFINTVNGHLWHLIPGAHFARPHTIEPNPRAYAIIDQHADHYHWDNGKDIHLPTLPGSLNDTRGGGHAHVGAMFALGDQWPKKYYDDLFMINFHGRRLNRDRPRRAGAGFVAGHQADMFQSADPWFRGIDLALAPDGSAVLIDWSDIGECHEHDGVDRGSGRIFRITYGPPRPIAHRDLAAMPEADLIALHEHPNEWFVRSARKALAARGVSTEGQRALRVFLDRQDDPVRSVRALCTLGACGLLSPDELLALSVREPEAIRVWSIRFLTDLMPIDTIMSRRGGADVEPSPQFLEALVGRARNDRSGLVRLALASSLQRLPVRLRPQLAAELLAHAEDANDPNLPALVWTGLIPVADAEPAALVGLAAHSRIPAVVRWIARRLAEDLPTDPKPLERLLADLKGSKPAIAQAAVLGLADSARGIRALPKPVSWQGFRDAILAADGGSLRQICRELDSVFGDGRAIADLKALALDESADLADRKSALASFIAASPPDLAAVCSKLLSVRFVNAIAVHGLATLGGKETGSAIARRYRSFHPTDRQGVVETLCSRPEFAAALLDEVQAKRIAATDITPAQARQIRGLGDPALNDRLDHLRGAERETSADRRARIADLMQRLTDHELAKADALRGRVVFEKQCASCHRLHGSGGDAGPDLTGSDRGNLHYILENLADPSAAVSADFRVLVVNLKDGRTLTGIAREKRAGALVLRTPTETVVLDANDIEKIGQSTSSLMPDGLLDAMTPDELRDLIGFLRVPARLPGEPGGVTGSADRGTRTGR